MNLSPPFMRDSSDIDKLKPFFSDGSFRFISGLNFSLEEQIGNCCKPLAAYHLELIRKIQRNPDKSVRKIKMEDMRPLYTQNYEMHRLKHSHLAKAKSLGSSVGEIYGAQGVIALLKQNNINAVAIHPPSESIYIAALQAQIKKNQPTLVFFDAGDVCGRPVLAGSKYEHGAVVVGYGEKNGIDYFVIGHWGQFHIVEAKKLAASARQLIERTPETFYLIKDLPKAKWLTAADINNYRNSFLGNITNIVSRLKAYDSMMLEYQQKIADHQVFIEKIPKPNPDNPLPSDPFYQQLLKQAQEEIARKQSVVDRLIQERHILKVHLSHFKMLITLLPTSFDDTQLSRMRRSNYNLGSRSLRNTLIFAKAYHREPKQKLEAAEEKGVYKRMRV